MNSYVNGNTYNYIIVSNFFLFNGRFAFILDIQANLRG